MSKIQIIIATEQDGSQTRTVLTPCKIYSNSPDFSLSEAVRQAVAEYLHTEEGKETYEYNHQCFDWADFDTHVPNRICQKYGFEKIAEPYDSLMVDWDEQLADGVEFHAFWKAKEEKSLSYTMTNAFSAALHKKGGYQFLARDLDGTLHAFVSEPFWNGTEWKMEEGEENPVLLNEETIRKWIGDWNLEKEIPDPSAVYYGWIKGKECIRI